MAVRVQQPSTDGGLAYTLTQAAQAWRTQTALALRPWALTVPQFLVLITLYRPARLGRPLRQQADVAFRLGMDANTTSQVVRGLESRGVLIREPHPVDRRARSLELTEAGLDLARSSSAAARASNDSFFGEISLDDQEALARILASLTARARQRTNPGGIASSPDDSDRSENTRRPDNTR